MEGDNWLVRNWRPLMAWQYGIVCLIDFGLGPLLMPILSAYLGTPVTPWSSTTIAGGSTYHIAMGAIVGVSAWSRGQEKITALKVESGSAEVK